MNPANAERVRDEALALPAIERASLVELLLASLDQPDDRIEQLWAIEANRRLAAFKAGETTAIPMEEVFAELDDF